MAAEAEIPLEPLQTVELKTVIHDVAYRAPGKNETEMRKAVREAAREFLSRTGVWKEARRGAHLGSGWYGFELGHAGAEVIRVERFHEGERLGPTRPVSTWDDWVAPMPGGIPAPLAGNPDAPNIAEFIAQGGYVLVRGPDSLPAPPPEVLAPDPHMPKGCIDPVMTGSPRHSCAGCVLTLNMGFGGEVLPEAIVRRYGSVIADGAAHILLAGPNVAQTAYGQRFTNACDEVAFRMAHGGATAATGGTIVTGTLEI